jgi:hypothetical protein
MKPGFQRRRKEQEKNTAALTYAVKRGCLSTERREREEEEELSWRVVEWVRRDN